MKRLFSLMLAVAIVFSTSVVSTLATENDFDGDGLTDKEESLLKTNPKATDTDADGLSDGEEVDLYKTNPTKADTDKDDLLDGDEIFTYKTSPIKHDTDSDGFSDSSEIKAYETDPLQADTDNDGLMDQEEVVTHKTDPLDADSDNDGLKDGTEYMGGYDPLEDDIPYAGGGVKCDTPEIQSIYYGSEKIYPFGKGPLSIDSTVDAPITFEVKECPYDGITYTLEFDADKFSDNKDVVVLKKDAGDHTIMVKTSTVLDTFFEELGGTTGKGSFRVVTSTGSTSKVVSLDMDFEGYVPGVDTTVKAEKKVKVEYKPKTETTKKVAVKKKKVNPVGPKKYKPKPRLNDSGNPEAVFKVLPEEELTPSFVDTGDHWAANAIEKLRQFGLINGKGNRQYEPNSWITRGELVTMAMKSFNHDLEKYEGVKVFKDVDTDQYYASAVAAAYDLGIVSGYKDGTFKPYQHIKRAEAVKIFLLAAGVRVDGDEVTTKFKDVKPGAWYMPFIAKSAENNVVRGYYNTNLFGPENKMTRGESASVIHQIIFEFYMYM